MYPGAIVSEPATPARPTGRYWASALLSMTTASLPSLCSMLELVGHGVAAARRSGSNGLHAVGGEVCVGTVIDERGDAPDDRPELVVAEPPHQDAAGRGGGQPRATHTAVRDAPARSPLGVSKRRGSAPARDL